MYPSILTAYTAQKLIGKTIKWHAPAYKANEDYEGVAKITTVDLERRKPVFTITIEGDCLDYAFVNDLNSEDFENKLLCYSDSDRYVTFEVISELNLDETIVFIKNQDIPLQMVERKSPLRTDRSGQNERYQWWLSNYRFSSDQTITYEFSLFDKETETSLFDREITQSEHKKLRIELSK